MSAQQDNSPNNASPQTNAYSNAQNLDESNNMPNDDTQNTEDLTNHTSMADEMDAKDAADTTSPANEAAHTNAPAHTHAQQEESEQTAKLQAELADLKDKYIRSVAEMENIRKRSARERQDVTKYAISSFAKDLLDFSDNFRRAIESIPEELKSADERIASTLGGLEAMEREFLRMFDRHGVKKIEPLDELFNPNFHEVMFESPSGGKPAGTIIQIIEPGYLLHDRLLRPARVGIAKNDGQNIDGTPPQGGANLDQEV